MDPGGRFLCAPADPSGTIEQIPFVDGEHGWDGGQFMLFANRKKLLDHVPIAIREVDDGTPYLDAAARISLTERHSFYQTWFFFGLLAEFSTINDLDDHAADSDVLKKRSSIQQLYDDFTEDDGAKKCLSISKMFERRILYSMMCSLRDHATGQVSRFAYLYKCLKFTYRMVNMACSQLDKPNWMANRALGEFLTTALVYASGSGFLDIPNPPGITFPWAQHPQYMGRGPVRKRMLDAGWCESDIDRIGLTYQRLNTQHFLSHLKRHDRRWDHSSCSREKCNAAHIVPQTYKLSHAQDGCGCSEICVDLETIQQVLRDTSTFPILRVHADGDLKNITIGVEPYKGDEDYVAILMLQETVEAKTSESCQPYLLWIDTLCCPAVEPQTKAIALKRLRAVYTKAKHVLVLDSSIYSFPSQGVHPAEALDFASIVDEATELYKVSTPDPRYRAIFLDVSAELFILHGFFQKHLDESYSNEPMWEPSSVFDQLWTLQRSLHFRSVSVESDEPLCIATLLSLDLGEIATVQGLEARMVQVWKQVAEKGKGFSPRIIFYVDNPIVKRGFGWAPKSLLGSETYSALNLGNLTGRFSPSRVTGEPIDPDYLGFLSSYGLRVRLPGQRICLKLWREDSPFWLWEGLLDTPRAQESIVCRDESTGRWFRVSDYLRSKTEPEFPDEELPPFDDAHPHPLIEDLLEGKLYLIQDVEPWNPTAVTTCLMVRVRQDIPSDCDDGESIYVYSRRTVLFHEVDRTYARSLDAFREIAVQVAKDEVTQRLIEIGKSESIKSVIYQSALASVVQLMKDLFDKAFDTDPRRLGGNSVHVSVRCSPF
ncbi:hypothetical protein BU16DRAFT_536212 [Lophium mytilinum]|uniref:Heterokaryon incompatibility domain-containing protein n=1 Tax=Lophium mytilinum TaxID=390894 RepID=A0A6A6R410_9PEZI|nr:hypothetical protein BU16DRAFT_536212 [Lophium mytilinum]